MTDGLGALFDAHARDLFRYLSARAGLAAAEDLVADTFVAALRGGDSFDAERGTARAWLFGIASNLLRQHLRRQARRHDAIERLAGLAAAPVDAPDIDGRIDAAAHARRLVPHLGALAAVDLDILLLHAWAGLEPAEIAVALSRPAPTIRSRLSRLRRTLRAAAEDEPGGPQPVAAARSTARSGQGDPPC